MSATGKVHPFEASGFGHAPYSFVGASRQIYQAAPGAPVQPGSSCDYCGTGIMDVYRVRSADGVTFKVGSDCIRKVWAEYDETIPVDFRRAFEQAKRMKADAARERRWALIAARVAPAKEFLLAHPWVMASKPHPTPYRAEKGETLHDYLLWCLTSGPETSKVWACQMIDREQTAATAEASV